MTILCDIPGCTMCTPLPDPIVEPDADQPGVLVCRCAGYLEKPLRDMETAIQFARDTIPADDFDVIVVSGLSGTIFGSALALALNKKLAVVRKDADLSGGCHSGYKVEGWCGGRWIFVDDLIDTGATFARCRDSYLAACNDAGTRGQFIGQYLYFYKTFERSNFT